METTASDRAVPEATGIGFIQRELDRISTALRGAPSPECCGKLRLAHQALSWALEPVGFAAPFDVIITDERMPHLSGVELVRKLKERGFRGKIMVLSAHLTAELREAYAQMNVDVLLDKPFDIHQLRETLDLLVA